MDSFTDDLNSPICKQAHPMPAIEGVVMQRLTVPSTESVLATMSEVEERGTVFKPVSEVAGRIIVKRSSAASVVSEEHKSSVEDPWAKLSNDMVEYILARLPLSPIKVSKKVCKRWEAVINTPEFEILHKQLGEQQPWFVCYGMNHLVPSKSQAFAFNHESNTWIVLSSLQFPCHNFGSLAGASGLVSAIAGPGENKLKYKLTNTSSSTSCFKEMWYETPLMEFPRHAPVVCVAVGTGREASGHKVVVAGGVPNYEPEHMAVEIFDTDTGAWEVYESLPVEFSGSSSRLWMSGVVCENKFFVSLIYSWSMYSLDLSTNSWSCVHWERPLGLILHHIMAIGITLVVVGMCEDNEESTSLNLWKVKPESYSLILIGSMPKPFFATLDRSSEVPTLDFLINENLLYISKSNTQDRPVIVGEICLEECKTEWYELPTLPPVGYRFDNMVSFCTSMIISSCA